MNTASKVYHCLGDRYYGKTKQGESINQVSGASGGRSPKRWEGLLLIYGRL